MANTINLEQPAEQAGVIIPWTLPIERPSEPRLVETGGLVDALGCELAFLRAENVRKPTPGYFLSGGLLERLAEDVANYGLSIVVMDTSLTPIQQRNLEQALNVKVIDRTGLILEIFGLRARTREGRLQVELARLLYERSRLVRTWTHLERQRGGRGFLGGPGETQLEADKRMIDRAVQRLRADLEDVRRTRGVQRAGRKRRDVAMVALVGYTNAGKSSLFNRLTGADVMAKDMPFATLDTTIRKLELPEISDATLVDTVGFIADLPTHLIESFQATLEEILEADILVHVRDRSSENDAVQKQDVLNVLGQLATLNDAPLPPMLEAWNKVDCLREPRRQSLQIEASQMPEGECAVLVSAQTGEGIDDLQAVIVETLRAAQIHVFAQLRPEDGALRAWLHAHAQIESERYLDDGGSALKLWIDAQDWGRLLSQYPDQAVAQFRIVGQIRESDPYVDAG